MTRSWWGGEPPALQRNCLGRILLTKNPTLMPPVGLPILARTAAITVDQESGYRLALTLPAVLGRFHDLEARTVADHVTRTAEPALTLAA